jgi:hypothetical protein
MTAQAKIVVTGIDNASLVMRRIRAEMRAMTQPMRDVRKSMRGFAEASGLKDLASGFGKVARTARSVAGGVLKIVAPMAALLGAGTLAGIAELTNRWGQLGISVLRTSQNIGVAPGKLQALTGAARLAGLSADDMTSSLGALGNTLEDALYGRNQKALYMLHQLGIQIHRTSTGAVDSTRALMDLSGVLQRYNGKPQVQQQIADSFGVGSLLPLLRQGPAAIRAFEAQARRLGAVLSGPELRRADELGLAFLRMKLGIEGLRNSISDGLFPVLTPLLEQFTEWVSANRQLIAQRLAEWVQKVVTWVRAVDWGKVWGDIRAVARSITEAVGAINGVAQGMGGWKNTIELMFGAWALGKVTMFSLALYRVAKGLGAVRAAAAAATAAGAATGGAGTATGAAAGAATVGTGGAALIAGAGLAAGYGLYYSFKQYRHDNAAAAARQAAHAKDFARNGYGGRMKRGLSMLLSMGLSRKDAAGLMANFTAESGLSPTAVGDNGKAYGIGQWHADRQAMFKKLFGHDIRKSSFSEQLAFARWELGNTESAAQRRAGAAGSAAEAGATYSRYYERPGDAAGQALLRAHIADYIYRQNFGRGGAAQGAQRVDVHVRMTGAPAGTRVEARDDQGREVPARIGYNWIGAI